MHVRWCLRRAAASIVTLAALALSASVLADVPSLIAGLHRGDELRYTYTLTTDETIGVTGKVGEPGTATRSIGTQTIGVVFRCTADTTALNIVEATFETVKVSMEAGESKFEVDVDGAAPDDKAGSGAKNLYQWFRPLLGAKITFNTSPGAGEISSVRGGEELLKSPGGALLKRYVDPDLFRATFGDVFQLKSNSMMPPPGEKWYIKVHAYARATKAPVWETRSVDKVEGGIASVRGVVKAAGKPEDAAQAPVFFRNIDAGVEYSWDTTRGRLTSYKRSETIGTRFERSGVMQDSDLSCVSTLTMAEKAKEETKGGPPPERGEHKENAGTESRH